MTTAIDVQNLQKSYGDRAVLHGLSFQIPTGQIFGFLGPNGSGKSTTIKILCGLLTPNAGSASILGYDVQTQIRAIRSQIGYMSQQFGLYDDLTVLQNIIFYGGLYGVNGTRFDERLEAVLGLTKITPYLNQKAGRLSGGWKQRLALACAILHEPKVIFLDEPTAGIDPVARRDLWDLLFDLSSQGVTLFVTTHYMDEAERCHQVAYIFEGRLIACGSSQELRALDSITPDGYRRLEILCDPFMGGYRLLDEHTAVNSVTIFGNALHTIVSNAFSDMQLRRYLQEAGINVVHMAEMSPTLEDVFVSLTQLALAHRESIQ
jgi:ABC-type multidrug transport system ATPase subunit